MLARTWAVNAARAGAGVLLSAATAAIIIAPAAQSEPTAEVVEVRAVPLNQERPIPGDDVQEILANAASASAGGADARAEAAERANRAVVRRMAAMQQASFATYTLKSKDTRDMRGVERSLYRGRFFHSVAEDRRLCIVERESEGHYDVVNPGGNYFGAYQVSRALAEGATYMMADEHKALMGTDRAKEILADLRGRPMNTWPRYWQDAAFHTIMNWEGPMSGAAHWAGGRWHC